MALNEQMRMIVSGFITILLGVVLLGVVANNTFLNTNLNQKENETITISGTVTTYINETINITSFTGITTRAPIVGVSFFGNATNATTNPAANSKPNISIDVNFTRDGVIRISGAHFDNSASSTYNITYEVLSATAADVINEQVLAVSSFQNVSIGTQIVGITINDDINFTKAGRITVSPFNFSGGPYNITYSYGGDNYIEDSTARVFINLIPLFFAIGVVLAGIGMVYAGFREAGLLG